MKLSFSPRGAERCYYIPLDFAVKLKPDLKPAQDDLKRMKQ